jgi:site-specific DNA-methyltransferase (adenine-specific)
VKNAATRKYLTGDHLWYFPPPDVFRRLVDFANAHGNPTGRPYFSLDGKTSLAPSQWEQFRGKFYCEAGVTNVWHVPAVRGKERIKVRGNAVHPNQKPLALMRRLVKSCSDPGEVVWEPFGGLCTASIAAAEIGRRAFAAEIRPAIYERALQRIEQAA